jgi:hypothetical protein
MTLFEDFLAVDRTSSYRELVLAADLLERCAGVVSWEGILLIRPTREYLICDVIDTDPYSHRCAEEFAVLVENARLTLGASKLQGLMPHRRQVWRVTEGTDKNRVLWTAP